MPQAKNKKKKSQQKKRVKAPLKRIKDENLVEAADNAGEKFAVNAASEMSDKSGEEPYRIVFSWETVDFIKNPKTKFYLISAVIGSMGMILWGISTRSFTVVLTFIMLAVVSIMVLNEPSQKIKVKITEEGVDINDNHFQFRDFKSFKVSNMHDMPVLHLYRNEKYLPPKMIYIEDEPVKDLQDFLGIYLPEEE